MMMQKSFINNKKIKKREIRNNNNTKISEKPASLSRSLQFYFDNRESHNKKNLRGDLKKFDRALRFQDFCFLKKKKKIQVSDNFVRYFLFFWLVSYIQVFFCVCFGFLV